MPNWRWMKEEREHTAQIRESQQAEYTNALNNRILQRKKNLDKELDLCKEKHKIIRHSVLNGNAVISCGKYNRKKPKITLMFGIYCDLKWISYKVGNLPNGFMSYFGTTLSVSSSGIYTIYMSADDQGTLYINGKEIGSTNESESWHQVNEYRIKLNNGIYGITVSVKNDCPSCHSSDPCSNPSSLALFIKDPHGIVVIATGTDWKASSSPINYNTLQGIVVARKVAILHNKREIAIESVLRKKKEVEIEKVVKVATMPVKKYVYKKGVGIVYHTPSILTSGKSLISNNKIQIVKKEVSNTNIVKHEFPIVTSGESLISNNKIQIVKKEVSNTNIVKYKPSIVTSGDNIYNKPDDLLHIENVNSSKGITANKVGLLDIVKKYWWIGLLAVGHII